MKVLFSHSISLTILLLLCERTWCFMHQLFKSTTIIPYVSTQTRNVANNHLHYKNNNYRHCKHQRRSSSYSNSALFGGTGKTANYEWKEDQFEIEIKFSVPTETKAKHVIYKPKSKSIELLIEIQNEKKLLLDGDRKFRGMADLDGTFWSLHDSDDGNGRELVVTIEKFIVPPSDPFAVVEYDWGSVYLNDDDEILSKEYEEPEELDVREYASSLGVDIDNINMTMVDKTMFASGLNMTKSTMEELSKSGYVQEVTRQGDGSEFIESGTGGDKKSVPFKSLGDNVGDDEIKDARLNDATQSNPFVDSDSPWRQNMPVEEARGINDVDSSNDDNGDKVDAPKKSNASSQDPIDRLTVAKLKEILKKEGLKVSGNKIDLQQRLKDHVNKVMQRKRNIREDSEDESFQ